MPIRYTSFQTQPVSTPGARRVLFSLLAVESCLLLLGRLRWFGLVRDTGGGEIEALTFLIGLAAPVLAGLLGFIWWLIMLGARRRFQSSRTFTSQTLDWNLSLT